MRILFAILISLFTAQYTFAAWSVDKSKSEFGWMGKKVVGEKKHTGTLKLSDAKVVAKKGKITGGEFVIDMKSIDVTDLTGKWKKKFLDHIKTGDFFEVEKYPTAKLVLTEMKAKMAKGKLTIKDKTQPVDVKFSKKGMEYTGTLIVDRTKFGIIYGSKNFFKKLTMDKVIADTFEITFKVVVKGDKKKLAKSE